MGYLLARIRERITRPPMFGPVRALAPRYFGQFGYEGDPIVSQDGKELALELEHCTVYFFFDRGEFGSYIHPRKERAVIQYGQSDAIAWDAFRTRLWRAIEGQMQIIVERFLPALEGDFSNWPTT